MSVKIMVPLRYALPATPQGFLDTFYPMGVVRDDRGVVGVWCLFLVAVEDDRILPDGTFNDGGYVCIAVRTKAGHPFGAMDFQLFETVGAPESWPAAAAAMAETALGHPALTKKACNFPAALDKAGVLTPTGNTTTRLADFRRKLDLHYPGDKDANARIAADHLAKASPFTATIDPEALAFFDAPEFSAARAGGWMSDKVWSGMDATFTPNAPLRAAIRKLPQHGELLAIQWARRPWETDADPATLLTEAVAVHAKEGVRAHPSFARSFLDRSDQVTEACKGRENVDFSTASSAALWAFCPFPRDTPRRRESLLACLTARLPLDWLPSVTDEWEALAMLAEALWMAGQVHPQEDAQHLVNAKGRWREYAETLSKAAGGADIQNAVNDVSDMVSAFSLQILHPSSARTGDFSLRGRNDALGRDLLFRGMSLARILEASRRWHGRQGNIDAAISAISPELEFDDWKAGLPDWETAGRRIAVLTTKTELADEGRNEATDGCNPDGTTGLAHCVGGYSDRCRTGTSRILSVRSRLPGGGFKRLSTAEISVAPQDGARPLTVVMHRGHGNGDAPPEAEALLAQYLEKCRAGTLKIDGRGLAALPMGEGVMAKCGYDWRVLGNVEKAVAAWAPCLPRRLRTMTPEDMVTTALAASGIQQMETVS
jgi:hypothetical protein